MQNNRGLDNGSCCDVRSVAKCLVAKHEKVVYVNVVEETVELRCLLREGIDALSSLFHMTSVCVQSSADAYVRNKELFRTEKDFVGILWTQDDCSAA